MKKKSKKKTLSISLDTNGLTERFLVTTCDGKTSITPLEPGAFVMTKGNIKTNIREIFPGHRLVTLNEIRDLSIQVKALAER